MTAQGIAVFETVLGHCGIAWGEHGVVGVRLPEGNAARTLARLQASVPDAVETEPPGEIQLAIAEIVALLRGEPRDLAAVRLDYTGVPEFHRRVYELARTIPPGKTLTYGDVAHQLGLPGSAQAVGQALGRNPFPIVVPCHRVLAAGGGMGGFSAPGGVDTKLKMLVIEGALSEQPTLF
ncbi:MULTISPECIES: methylated-DNA--[protein]-cysteine S-methyltransferase [Amycolatopsis]|uniref:methylated-DNA--[protein]-cysteine S-methyltransferase n=2 Tax=Amycolatopsis TaxID=1813 RepID=A0A1I4DT10_9PSEU|nr:methylated-DNA--[protein]-cysteine S-methyltransferase [Amycolatopsis sacchari]SFK95186.1 methylated-DNA-[protein]-cysteine S-methyltransferase [Amycolatopsis sacchari]